MAGVILTSNRGLRKDMAQQDMRKTERTSASCETTSSNWGTAWAGWSIAKRKLEGLLERIARGHQREVRARLGYCCQPPGGAGRRSAGVVVTCPGPSGCGR